MCFPVSAAGFFAKSQIMFFLPSSFRFCPWLKNDGTSGLNFSMVLHPCLSFLNEAVRIRAVGTSIKYSNLCAPTAPFTSSMTAGEFFSLHKTPKTEHL